MSFLFQLIFLASHAQQVFGSWGVTYPQSLQSVQDSCLQIPCTFSYPSTENPEGGIVAIWYKDYESQHAVIYHSATPSEVNSRFQGRTELLGDLAGHNCTLLLRGMRSEDSGKYNFRFEINRGNRWSDLRGVMVTVTDAPTSPAIAAPEDVREGVRVNFTCSSPYACPYDSTALQWSGYNALLSTVSGAVQLDTAGVLSRQILVTSLSWQDHSKKLLCEVSVGSKQATGEIVLRVKHSPKGTKVVITPSTKNIRVGDSVSLTCSVNSTFPEVTAYKWYKGGTALGSQQILTLQSVAREDYGPYHCEAENSVGTGVAEAVVLYVFSAVVSVSPSAEIQTGETVTLTCAVPGEENQDLSYTWYKNNVWIKEGTVRSLVFHEVTSSDTGYYSCKVQNDKGSQMSQAISLSVFYPPRALAITLFQETQEGKLALIHCTVDSDPLSALALYRNEALVATTSSHAAPTQRLSITASRNSLKLEILNVLPEDDGQYRCTASNAYGNATAAKLFHAQTARVLIGPAPEVREGDTVTLTCVTTRSAEEGPSYTWYKNTAWLKESSENTLVLPAASSRDAGAFQCKAQTKRGSSTSPAVTLRVLFPPRRPQMSSLLETQNRHLGIVLCTTDSDPQSELALYRGDELVASTSGSRSLTGQRLRATPSYNSLKVEIREVVLEDEGTYVCLARNAYGNASTSMVFSAETARVIATPASEVQEGQGVNLTCQVSSNSSAMTNYSWYRNGQWLSTGLADSLVFQRVASADAGVYYCKATNNRTSRSSTLVSLNVLYAPRNPRMTSFLEAEMGRLAIIRCVVDSNPPAQLSLYKGDELVASTSSRTAATQRIGIAASPNSLRVEIRDITLEDEGNYRFTASNAYGTSSGRLYFRVQTARVLITPSTDVQEGEDVSLTCDVTGNAPEGAIYTWYKNSHRLQESSESSLAFPHVTSGDSASYHCKAHSPEGTSSSISPAVRLHVSYPPREPELTSFLETPDGQLGVLQCTVDSDPQSQLSLFRGGELVASTTGSHRAAGQRVSVSSSHNSLKVEIQAVVMEDEGKYVCSASNAYGNSTTSLNFTAETARVWISPSPDVHEGDAVNLTCAVDSDAPGMPHYTWYKNNVWFSKGPGRSLTFPKVTTADAASYHCTVKTQERVRSSSPGTLNVLYPPRNLWVKSFLETQDGKLAIIVCAVDSNPQSELALRRAGELVASGSSRGDGASGQRLRVSSSPNTLKLEIRSVTLEDEGTYVCSANNAIGEASTSVYFTIETVRVVIQAGPDVREGDHITLTCEDTSARPSIIYTWYKNTKWLAEGPGSSLTIRGAAGTDAGLYSCTAHNDRGRRTSLPTALRVLYAPRKPSLISFLDAQDGHQAIIQCTVDSYPPSDVALYRGAERTPMASTRGSRGSPNQRLSIHVSHNSLKVEMKDVMLEDAGQYVCSANNTYGSAAASVRFGVETVRIMIEPSQEIHEGVTVNVTCLVADWLGGETNYTWYKNSKWLQDGPVRSLHLDRVSSADTGSYHCRAEGRTGSAISALVSLDVLYAPRNPSMNAFLENRNARVGLIHCTADSNPRAELALYREDKLVASSQGPRSAASQRVSVFPSYNTLRVEIWDVTSADSAEYTCVASNALGNVTATSYFSAQTLADLRLYKILAGMFIAALGAIVLAIAVVLLWPRITKLVKPLKDESSMELTGTREQLQVDDTSSINR
ncbi:sialoadhesin isoform X1 [Chrysemys picta bellii]|uniref:sialoadhesin isoform X1 n=1 Tax=Chrysemys picta bellii TaxID=8478 RepID=UPI0032B2B83B